VTATTIKSKRRENDFYPTPSWATQTLVESCSYISGEILECCSGAGDITRSLQKYFDAVRTNDIDSTRDTDYHFDLSTPIGWLAIAERPDWVITNPPFCHAPEMVPLAYDFAKTGIAMLLRITFLEPCGNRIAFLSEHPPTQLLVVPRISFTGDGRTDSTCTAWFIWDKRIEAERKEQGAIVIVGGQK